MPDLSHLRTLLGDDMLVARFLEMFKQETPAQLHAMQQYIAQENWRALAISAHSLKSQLRYLGFEKEATLAQWLETAADQCNAMGTAADRLLQLDASLRQAIAALV